MNDTTIIILIIAAVAVFCGYVIWQRFNRPKKIEQRVRDITNRRILPSGLHLWVEDGANVTPSEIHAIETGIRECLSRPVIAERGYTKALAIREYHVAILKGSKRAPESKVWSYKVPVTQYGGSPFSFGKYILAAGQVVEPVLENIIALPDYHGENTTLPSGQTDLQTLSGAAANEVEHIVLAHNDPAEFARTRTHGPTTPHPLF